MSFYKIGTQKVIDYSFKNIFVLQSKLVHGQNGEYLWVYTACGKILIFKENYGKMFQLFFVKQCKTKDKEKCWQPIQVCFHEIFTIILEMQDIIVLEMGTKNQKNSEHKFYIQTQESLYDLLVDSSQENVISLKSEFKSLSNKQIKVEDNEKKLIITAVGRTSNSVVYYRFLLDKYQKKVNILIQFNQKIDFTIKISIQSTENSLILVPSYINQFKPIDLIIVNFIKESSKEYLSVLTKFNISTFAETMVITNIYEIRKNIFVILSNNPIKNSTFIVVYDTSKEFTLNYLEYPSICCDKANIFGIQHLNLNPQNNFSYYNQPIYLDIVFKQNDQQSILQSNILCSYENHSIQKLSQNSKQSFISQNFILIQNQQQQLHFIPKISKKQIYHHFLQNMIPKSRELIHDILDIL